EERRSAPEAGIIAELRRGDDQAFEQQSGETDEQQLAAQLDPLGFLTKARLRRLLMSDDVWSFRRKRHPAEFAPDEDAVVPAQGAEGQQNEPDEPDLPARYPCHSQAQHQVRDERQLASAAQTPGHQVRDERQLASAAQTPGHQVRDERQLASAAQMPGHQRDPNNTSHPTGQEMGTA
ncbi:hypothetical protein AALO_G00073880, partial [Alosa alosa]